MYRVMVTRTIREALKGMQVEPMPSLGEIHRYVTMRFDAYIIAHAEPCSDMEASIIIVDGLSHFARKA